MKTCLETLLLLHNTNATSFSIVLSLISKANIHLSLPASLDHSQLKYITNTLHSFKIGEDVLSNDDSETDSDLEENNDYFYEYALQHNIKNVLKSVEVKKKIEAVIMILLTMAAISDNKLEQHYNSNELKVFSLLPKQLLDVYKLNSTYHDLTLDPAISLIKQVCERKNLIVTSDKEKWLNGECKILEKNFKKQKVYGKPCLPLLDVEKIDLV